jgi:hypothetical protein
VPIRCRAEARSIDDRCCRSSTIARRLCPTKTLCRERHYLPRKGRQCRREADHRNRGHREITAANSKSAVRCGRHNVFQRNDPRDGPSVARQNDFLSPRCSQRELRQSSFGLGHIHNHGHTSITNLTNVSRIHLATWAALGGSAARRTRADIFWLPFSRSPESARFVTSSRPLSHSPSDNEGVQSGCALLSLPPETSKRPTATRV